MSDLSEEISCVQVTKKWSSNMKIQPTCFIFEKLIFAVCFYVYMHIHKGKVSISVWICTRP